MRRDAHAPAREDLQGDAARDRHGGGEAPGEVPAAADVLMPLPAHLRGQVSVRGAREVGDRAVVLRALVGVADDRGEGRAAGDAVHEPAEDLRGVGLPALRGEAPPRSAPGHEGRERLEVDRLARREALDRAADRVGVGLSEDGRAEIFAEGGVHDL